jgi:hypothetical protein
MADKSAMFSYTSLTKQQSSATHDWQSSNNHLHMGDKAAMMSYK